MKFLQTFIVLLLVLLPGFALGQEARPIETIPPGTDRIVSLRAGAPAPYPGQLFDNATALRWANWLTQYQLRLDMDVEEQKQLCATRLKAKDDILAARQDACSRAVGSCQTKVTQLAWQVENPAWYRTSWFGAILGAVGVGLVVVLVGN